MTTETAAPTAGGMPALMSVEAARLFCGRRGRGWIYERIRTGDFETIVDGGRRLILTSSILNYIERLRRQPAA